MFARKLWRLKAFEYTKTTSKAWSLKIDRCTDFTQLNFFFIFSCNDMMFLKCGLVPTIKFQIEKLLGLTKGKVTCSSHNITSPIYWWLLNFSSGQGTASHGGQVVHRSKMFARVWTRRSSVVTLDNCHNNTCTFAVLINRKTTGEQLRKFQCEKWPVWQSVNSQCASVQGVKILSVRNGEAKVN